MRNMTMRLALAASILGAAMTPVLAQGVPVRPLAITVAPGANPGPGAFRPVMGRDGAKHAANMVGVAEIDDVDLDDTVWTVTGTDVHDKDMTVLIDARSGRILQARYD